MLETLHALNSEQVQRRLQTHSTSLDSPQEGPSLSGAAEGVDRLRVTPTVMQSGIALAAQPTVPLSQELSRTRQQQQTQSSSSSSSGMQRKFVNLSSSQSGGGSVGESVDPVKLRRWWTLVSSLLSVLDRPDLQSNSGEYEKDVACLSSDVGLTCPFFQVCMSHCFRLIHESHWIHCFVDKMSYLVVGKTIWFKLFTLKWYSFDN